MPKAKSSGGQASASTTSTASSKKRETNDKDYDDQDTSDVPDGPVTKKAKVNAESKSAVVPPKVVKRSTATAAKSQPTKVLAPKASGFRSTEAPKSQAAARSQAAGIDDPFGGPLSR